MFIANWKKEIFTIPNLLSIFRLVLLPVYSRIYLNATENYHYLIAGSIMGISCITDMLGKILDPLADKITQFTLTLCLSLKYPVLHPILALFILKELFQLTAGIIFLQKGRMLPGALIAGKICTSILFVSLIILVFFPNLNSPAVNFIALVDGIFLIISFVSYILAYFGKDIKLQDLEK